MVYLAGLCGFLVVGGLWFAVTGLRPVPIIPKPPTSVRATDPMRSRRIAATVFGAFVAVAVTRWPVAAVAGGVAGWVLAGTRGWTRRDKAEKRTEAIALWCEMLRDAIGTSRGIEGVLVATAATSPLPIREELATMADRLQREPLDLVLDGLAADLDHPLGDLVVTALRLTSTAGGGQVRDVLASLSTAAYAEAESHRRIEVARERPRAAMRYSAIIICGFVGLLLVFSGRYLAPYRTALGQVVLLIVGGYWAAGFWWMARMGRPEVTDRYLKPNLSEPVEVAR